MELPDLGTLESHLPFASDESTGSSVTSADNITGEIDSETKALIDKVNSSSPTNFDETEIRELHDHIEKRRELAEKLEKDKKFREEYVARQKLLSDAKTIKDATDVEKEFEKFTNFKLGDAGDGGDTGEQTNGMEFPEFSEIPEMPEMPEVTSNSGARNVIHITNSHNITLHFH